MKRRLSILAVIVTAATVAAPVASASADEVEFTFHGGGWGHGVGMSQYGAYGQALAGRSGEEILTHYYQGATVVPASSVTSYPDPLWIGLVQNQTFVDFVMSGGTGSLCLANDGLGPCPYPAADPSRQALAGELWRFQTADPAGATCIFAKEEPPGSGTFVAQGPAGSCGASISWDPGARIGLPNQGRTYAYGVLRFRPAPGGTFNEVLTVPLEQYLYGIRETISSWPLQAHRAQAIAARSYAIARAVAREPSPDPATFDPDFSQQRKDFCYCHLVDDTRDQFFVGYDSWDSNVPGWAEAVNTTAGLVLTHNGAIATTYYASSTYGATEPVEVGFGGSPVPYLVSVPDPWSADPGLNPNARWQKAVDGGTLAATVGLPDVVAATITAWSPSGAARTIRFHSSTGAAIEYPSRSLRTPLGLKSPQVFAVTYPLAASGPDGVALHDPATGMWHVRGGNGAVLSFYFGNPADIPYSGDWDGDGVATPGLYRSSTGFLFLRNSNTEGIADIQIYYGDPDDLPVAGDWDGDGIDTVGIYRPSESTFYLRNSNTQGIADIIVPFGDAGDVPLVGDWNGDGIDSVGVFRPSTLTLYLTNGHDSAADLSWVYTNARATDKVVIGDWDGDGIDTVGVFRPTDATFYLRDTLSQPSANVMIPLGSAAMSPVTGWWGM